MHAHPADGAKVLEEGRDLLGVFGGEDKFPTDADAPVFGICVKARHRNVAEGGKITVISRVELCYGKRDEKTAPPSLKPPKEQ